MPDRDHLMRKRAACLRDLADAIAAGQSDRFQQLVKSASRAGANREELLVAVQIGRSVAQAPVSVLAEAYAAIDCWGASPGGLTSPRPRRPLRRKLSS